MAGNKDKEKKLLMSFQLTDARCTVHHIKSPSLLLTEF